MTIDLIAAAGLGASMSYLGGGSSLGGTKMSPSAAGQGPNGNQQVAPQSRFLNATECSQCENADSGGACVNDTANVITNRGQGYGVALDGLAVHQDATSGCRVLRYAGCMAVQDRNANSLLGYGNGTVGIDDGTGATATLFLEDGPDGNGVLDHYCFRHWADALRIIYNGQHAHLDDSSSAAACASTLSASAIANKRCNSDVRHTLVSRWENLFDTAGDDGAGGCVNGLCTAGLKHAYRRDDFSGTTDAFLSILGVPSLGSAFNVRTFCNGLENEDHDPVRRPCNLVSNAANDTDTVCSSVRYRDRNAPFGADGSPTGQPGSVLPTPPPSQNVADPNTWADLGLVLPVSLPTQVAPQFDNVFCTNAPAGGSFRFAQAPNALALAAQRCPDGNPRSGGQCRAPVGAPATARAGLFNCKSRRTNRPGGAGWPNFDARAYNLVPRDPTTGTILQANSNSITDPRWGGGGHYRIHQTFPKVGTGTRPVCNYPDATRQIGCLVEADPCSIGFAGLEASDRVSGAALTGNEASDLEATIGTNTTLLLRAPLDTNTSETSAGDDLEVEATVGNVRRFLEPSGSTNAACTTGSSNYDQRYGLSRLLWLTASKGFGPRGVGLDFSNPAAPPVGGAFNITDSVVSSDGVTPVTTNEGLLTRSYLDRDTMDPIVCRRGFIPLDDSLIADCELPSVPGACTTDAAPATKCTAGSTPSGGAPPVSEAARFRQCP
jgi:hypothetical protein